MSGLAQTAFYRIREKLRPVRREQGDHRWRVSCDARPGIVVTNALRLMPVVGCLVVGLSVVHAKHPDTNTLIRPLDSLLRAIVEAGRSRSATFRVLADRLEAGDVVVYLQQAPLPGGVHGRLTFLSSAAGRRYLLVELSRDLDPPRLIAIVGHELRHAVEILERREIVDCATFATAYKRLGFKSRRFANGGLGFDTAAAVAAGRQVGRELAGSAVTLATR